MENPQRSAALAVLLAVVLAAVQWSFRDAAWTAISAIVLFLSMIRYFLPTRYELDSREIAVEFIAARRVYALENFRRAEAGARGVFLSPFPRPHRLDNFRGIYVLYGLAREEVLRRIAPKFEGKFKGIAP